MIFGKSQHEKRRIYDIKKQMRELQGIRYRYAWYPITITRGLNDGKWTWFHRVIAATYVWHGTRKYVETDYFLTEQDVRDHMASRVGGYTNSDYGMSEKERVDFLTGKIGVAYFDKQYTTKIREIKQNL